MLDSHGRNIRKLRISVTENCNFRCRYCMPLDVKTIPEKELLGLDELLALTAVLVDKTGIDEIRVTGGEPLLRSGVPGFVAGLKALKVARVGLTTNGFFLKTNLPALREAGLDNINISLDTLNEETFRDISRLTGISRIIDAVEACMDYGFFPKLNCVVMRNHNFSEVLDLLEFAQTRGLVIRFLEVMNIGVMRREFQAQYVSAREILDVIETVFTVEELPVPLDSTSKLYQTEKGRFGIIASESIPFCNTCSRLRLTARGKVMGCLFSEKSQDLRPLLGEIDRENLIYTAVERAIADKPYLRVESTTNQMYTLGG